MSYTLAKARAVAIVAGTIPTDHRLVGEGLGFVHAPDGRTGAKLRSRSFWLESNVDGDGGIVGPFTPDLAGQPRALFAFTLTVVYDLYEQRGVLDEVMAADQLAYTAALLQPSAWQSTTTGLLSLTTSPLFAPTRRVLVGARIEQRTTLALLFR